jgi:mannose-6-phosphate isomerase-like protein (cupin superfamily)
MIFINVYKIQNLNVNPNIILMSQITMKKPINLLDKFTKFSEQWSPKVIAEMNDYQFKLAKIQHEFTWHEHTDTDEAFLVVEGEMSIEFRTGKVDLKAGEMYVVPKGVEHRPFALKECKVMFIEPRGVTNTGDSGGEITAENDVWV